MYQRFPLRLCATGSTEGSWCPRDPHFPKHVHTAPPILHCKTAFVIKRFPFFKGRLMLAAWLLWIWTLNLECAGEWICVRCQRQFIAGGENLVPSFHWLFNVGEGWNKAHIFSRYTHALLAVPSVLMFYCSAVQSFCPCPSRKCCCCASFWCSQRSPCLGSSSLCDQRARNLAREGVQACEPQCPENLFLKEIYSRTTDE